MLRHLVTVVALAACATAIALPWELKAGLESITICSGLQPFLGTGTLLIIPVLFAFSLAVTAVAALSRRHTASIAEVLGLVLSLLPGSFLWSFLHRWRCLTDAP